MNKIDFVFLISVDAGWQEVFSHIKNLKKSTNDAGKFAVVAIGAALLSCLQRTNKKTLQETIAALSKESVEFFLCINTMNRYGVTKEMLLPEIKVAEDGGLMRTAKLEAQGYHKFQIG